MASVTSVLKKHHLKNTKLRVAVLNALQKANQGLNHQELSKLIDIDFDRVSLFRTLSQFEETGIVHKILDLNGVANYALNPLEDSISDKKCLTHFICLECEKITCIDLPYEMEQELKPPTDLYIEEIEVTYKGICKQCQKNK